MKRSEILLKGSWMAAVFLVDAADIVMPRSGRSHTVVFTLFSFYPTKTLELLFYILTIRSSTSQKLMRFLNVEATIRYRP